MHVDEKAYHADIDQLFLYLEGALESAEPELECDTQEGILTVTLPQGDQLIFSRQSVSQELWLASKIGAFHFQSTEKGWTTRKGETLMAVLKAIFEHFHIRVTL